MSKSKNGSLSKLADAAFKQAAKQVIHQAEQSRTPVIVWKDGRVQAVSSEELKSRRTRKKKETKRT